MPKAERVTEHRLNVQMVMASVAPSPVMDFAVRSGFWEVLNAAFQTADDLHDVIELLRVEKRFAASDRLRALQARLYDAAEPLGVVVPRPTPDQIKVLTQTGGA